MSRCTCNNPCTCYFEYDGDRPGTNYTLPYQYGRYSTRRKGSGTSADPYIIEFIDSESFKVEAGQARNNSNQTLASGSGAGEGSISPITTIDYETPTEFFSFFEGLALLAPGLMYPSARLFWFVTAEATFVNNQQSSGIRRLLIRWIPTAVGGTYGNVSTFSGDGVTIASNSSSGLPAGTEDITLNCSGMVPFGNLISSAENPGGSFSVLIYQNTGSNMTVNSVKFTAVAL